MDHFRANDGTELAFRVDGNGHPLICLAGGPMRDSDYLGDLGGLSAHRRLVVPDMRGTGRSAKSEDGGSYRCDRLVHDVEALREYLGLEQLDLLAHSAGANLAVRYAERYPHRVGRLALITPSTVAVGISATGDARIAVARLRKDEPWFPDAFTALRTVIAGNGTDNSWRAIDPFYFDRWDATSQAFQAVQEQQQNPEAAAGFNAEGAFDPDATRAALRVFAPPVLFLAGEFDLNSPPETVAEYASLVPNGEMVVQPRAGHFPWIDDPGRFVETTAAFLA